MTSQPFAIRLYRAFDLVPPEYNLDDILYYQPLKEIEHP